MSVKLIELTILENLLACLEFLPYVLAQEIAHYIGPLFLKKKLFDLLLPKVPYCQAQIEVNDSYLFFSSFQLDLKSKQWLRRNVEKHRGFPLVDVDKFHNQQNDEAQELIIPKFTEKELPPHCPHTHWNLDSLLPTHLTHNFVVYTKSPTYHSTCDCFQNRGIYWNVISPVLKTTGEKLNTIHIYGRCVEIAEDFTYNQLYVFVMEENIPRDPIFTIFSHASIYQIDLIKMNDILTPKPWLIIPIADLSDCYQVDHSLMTIFKNKLFIQLFKPGCSKPARQTTLMIDLFTKRYKTIPDIISFTTDEKAIYFLSNQKIYAFS